jgi:hypothetical protein
MLRFTLLQNPVCQGHIVLASRARLVGVAYIDA